jgi:hypothetical protein
MNLPLRKWFLRAKKKREPRLPTTRLALSTLKGRMVQMSASQQNSMAPSALAMPWPEIAPANPVAGSVRSLRGHGAVLCERAKNT